MEAVACSTEIKADSSHPFVSIIIPVRNGRQHIDRALSSCLKIKRVDIEIVVVDDGSTDGTVEYISQRYPSINVFRLTHRGGSGSAGRNAGINFARGRYIKFLDQDDLIQPRGFRSECQEALLSDADVVMSNWGVAAIDQNGCFRKRDLKRFSPPDPNRLIEAILLGENVPFTSAALYKRTYIQDELWDDSVSIIDDFDWFCRLAIKGGKFRKIDAISYYWRLHPGSIQGRSYGDGSVFQKFMSARLKVFRKIEKELIELGKLTNNRKELLARRYYESLRYLARYNPRECKETIKRIYNLNPSFNVDHICETDQKSLLIIRLFGLSFFLNCYKNLQQARRIISASIPWRPQSSARFAHMLTEN